MSIDAGAKGYSDVVKVLLDGVPRPTRVTARVGLCSKSRLSQNTHESPKSSERPARESPRSQNLARFLCWSQDLISTIGALDLNFLACEPCEP